MAYGHTAAKCIMEPEAHRRHERASPKPDETGTIILAAAGYLRISASRILNTN